MAERAQLASAQYEDSVIISGEDARNLLALAEILQAGDLRPLKGEGCFTWGKRIRGILDRSYFSEYEG